MFASLAITSIRRAAGPVRTIAQRRQSVACAQSVHKLNGILEEYRSKNYSREIPRRFRKDFVTAATEKSSPPAVTAEGIELVLQNIGMGDRISKSEIEGIINEVGACPVEGGGNDGNGDCVLSADQLLDLMSWDFRDL